MDCSSHSDMVSCNTLVYQGNGLTQLPAETTILSPSFYKTNDSELSTSSLPDGYIFQSRNTSLNTKVVATALPSHHQYDYRAVIC